MLAVLLEPNWQQPHRCFVARRTIAARSDARPQAEPASSPVGGAGTVVALSATVGGAAAAPTSKTRTCAAATAGTAEVYSMAASVVEHSKAPAAGHDNAHRASAAGRSGARDNAGTSASGGPDKKRGKKGRLR